MDFLPRPSHIANVVKISVRPVCKLEGNTKKKEDKLLLTFLWSSKLINQCQFCKAAGYSYKNKECIYEPNPSILF